MKRIICLVLLLAVLLLPAATLAEALSGDWQYTLNDEGRAIVVRYMGNAREVQMPWNLDGHIIVEIGEEAFANNTRLRSVKLPVGVSVIRMNAFAGCTQLTEVTLPVLLETIEDGAFSNCPALATINIPDSVAEIGEGVFDSAILLTGSADSLAPGYAAACGLAYAADASSTVVPAAKDPAADYQYNIRNGYAVITSYIGRDYEITVPSELGGYPVRAIGTNAFSSSYGVERVILPEGLTELERTAFRKCPGLTSIVLPSTLVSIGDNAFYQCENLQEIVIPASVISLGDRAFTGCSQLRSVTIYADLSNIRTYTFYQCHSTLTIYAPKGSAAERHAYSRGYNFVAIEK